MLRLKNTLGFFILPYHERQVIFFMNQSNNIKSDDENQIVLIDKNSNNKSIDWVGKKLKTIALSESYKRLGFKKSYRVKDCGTYLIYKKNINTGVKKLKEGNFCRDRLCPMCSWRRSLKIFGQVSKVMDKALEEKDYRFIFLTLTCKNVSADGLGSCLDNMFNAFNLLTKRVAFKKSIKGFFRGLEVTHNLDYNSDSFDTYHPHFHAICMVNKSYFNDRKYYISQEQWTSLWKSCLKIDYTPIVHVTSFKTSNRSSTSKSVAETAKYTVKDNDYIIPYSEELTDCAVMTLNSALKSRRLTAFGGELKRLHKELNLDDIENGDLVNTDNEKDDLREDIDYILEYYKWNFGYSQYFKMDMDLR